MMYRSCVFPQAETRAEFAERSVAKLEKTIDDLEGMFSAVMCVERCPHLSCTAQVYL